MSLRPLAAARKRELEDQAGPHGRHLAESLGERVHQAVGGFPASTADARSAICLLTADHLIQAAAQEVGVAADELADGE